MQNISSQKKGFTLIELLLVIGIIAILASVVIIAINPTKQLADARNTQRRSDAKAILDAVYQYAIDNAGNLPGGISTTKHQVCNTQKTTAPPAGGGTCAAPTGGRGTDIPYVDLSVLTTNGKYLVGIPVDPSVGTSTATGGTRYDIFSTNGRITVNAYGAENSAVISVTR